MKDGDKTHHGRLPTCTHSGVQIVVGLENQSLYPLNKHGEESRLQVLNEAEWDITPYQDEEEGIMKYVEGVLCKLCRAGTFNILVIACCLTSHPKLSALKQQTELLLTGLWVIKVVLQI